MTDLLDNLKRTLGDTYAFERELTGGGMSRLFLGEERSLNRKVVVKVFSEQLSGSVRIERFRREIQVSARLQHPHVVPVLSSGEVDGLPYYVMPFIQGESLRAHLDRSGELPVAESVRLLTQVASALSYAHKNGVVHRDIKPDNVLLSEDIAVVTDFGISKALADSVMKGDGTLTMGGLTVGTPAYMAPEQAVGEPNIDHRADIYSFGVVAYEMLTGTPLFTARTQQALMAAHAVTTPEPIERRRPTIPEPLAQLVMQCLEKSPDNRPQTVQEIIQRLGDLHRPAAVRSADLAPTIAVEPVTPVRSRRKFLIPAILAIIAAAAAAGYVIFTKPSKTTEISSIAVLPLENVGGDSADEYFSEGMTDELANALNKVPGMRLASRTSAFTFKNRRGLSVQEIGKQLNVQAIVEGSVRRAGGRLKVAAQLTSVRDGLSLWSNTYERQSNDVFGVQEDVAQAIAAAVKPKLIGGTAVTGIASRARGTDNPEAYDLYLRGQFYFNKRGADNLRQSIQYLEQAIAADSNFARAYATLATATALLPEYTDSPSAGVTERGRAAATRALQIDGTLGEANAALGLMAVHDWNFVEAGKRYRAAVLQEPGNAIAQQWYGEYFYHTGQADSAFLRLKMAQKLDPFAQIIPSAIAYELMVARQYPAAIDEINKGIQRYPDIGIAHAVASMANLFGGHPDVAVREAETASRLDPELVIRKGQLGFIYGKTGPRDDALKILRSLQADPAAGKSTQLALTQIYLGLEDYPNAIAHLTKAVDEHDIALVTSFTPLLHPMFDPLRSDPQFTALLRRMNLVK